MIAVEQGVVAQLVLQDDLGEVEAAAGGHRQPRRHVERIGGVEAGVQRRGAQSDRRHVAGRLVDEEPGTLDEGKLIGD